MIKVIGIKLRHILRSIRKRNSAIVFARNVQKNITLRWTFMVMMTFKDDYAMVENLAALKTQTYWMNS